MNGSYFPRHSVGIHSKLRFIFFWSAARLEISTHILSDMAVLLSATTLQLLSSFSVLHKFFCNLTYDRYTCICCTIYLLSVNTTQPTYSYFQFWSSLSLASPHNFVFLIVFFSTVYFVSLSVLRVFVTVTKILNKM